MEVLGLFGAIFLIGLFVVWLLKQSASKDHGVRTNAQSAEGAGHPSVDSQAIPSKGEQAAENMRPLVERLRDSATEFNKVKDQRGPGALDAGLEAYNKVEEAAGAIFSQPGWSLIFNPPFEIALDAVVIRGPEDLILFYKMKKDWANIFNAVHEVYDHEKEHALSLRFGLKENTNLITGPSVSLPETIDELKRALADNEKPNSRRHFVYKELIESLYKERNESAETMDSLIKYGFAHLAELEKLMPEVQASLGFSFLPRVSTFVRLATALTEQMRYDEAIEVCQIGIAKGYEDGTKGGFESRVERIRKKQTRNEGRIPKND